MLYEIEEESMSKKPKCDEKKLVDHRVKSLKITYTRTTKRLNTSANCT